MQIELIEVTDSDRPLTTNKKSSKNDITNSISTNKKQQSPRTSPLSPRKLAIKRIEDLSVKQQQQQQRLKQQQRKRLQQRSNAKVTQEQQQAPQEEEQQPQQPKFYRNKHKHPSKSPQKTLQRNVAYPQATIRQYLNQKRTSQNKVCHVLFCLYMIVIVMLMGVGFFYGSSSYLGKFISTQEENVDKVVPCEKYVKEDGSACVAACGTGEMLYLGRVCLKEPFTPKFSSALDKQISMYTLKESLLPIVYGSLIALVVVSVCFVCLICFAKLIYLYIGLLFLMLLGFAFFILKSVKTHLQQLSSTGLGPSTIFSQQASSIYPLAYILMSIYLIVFPLVLFSPSKIKSAVLIISKLSKYYSKMSSVNFFTFLIIYLTWGLCMLEIFLLINMFTSGNPSIEQGSFMFVFTKVSLSHPAVLVVHFFGVYWFFGTVVSWHKYFTSNAMCLWYFEDGEQLYPVRRGLKRSWYSLGTAAIDALLLPVQWVVQVVYAGTKIQEEEEQQATDHDHTTSSPQQQKKSQSSLTSCFCLHSIRQSLNTLYCKVNCHSSSSAPLTNYSFKQSCQISSITFTQRNHKFLNIGTTLTVLLTAFTTLTFLVICYFVLYTQVYTKSTPLPTITSLSLPVGCVFGVAVVVGALCSNMYAAAVDCLLFCWLLEKGKNVANTRNQVRDVLEGLYNGDGTGEREKVEVYQYQED